MCFAGGSVPSSVAKGCVGPLPSSPYVDSVLPSGTQRAALLGPGLCASWSVCAAMTKYYSPIISRGQNSISQDPEDWRYVIKVQAGLGAAESVSLHPGWHSDCRNPCRGEHCVFTWQKGKKGKKMVPSASASFMRVLISLMRGETLGLNHLPKATPSNTVGLGVSFNLNSGGNTILQTTAVSLSGRY